MVLLLVACTPLVGDWVGEIDCFSFEMDVEATLEWRNGAYEGEGELDCTDAWGTACTQTFDLEVEPGDVDGDEQELEVDLDRCVAEVNGFSSEERCDDPTDVTWDGANTIEGEWAGCELELRRD